MRYIVIDERRDGTGDMFSEEFNGLDEAIKSAGVQWNHLTTSEKANRTVYVLESANPDEEAADHFDGTPVWKDGRRDGMNYNTADKETGTIIETFKTYEEAKAAIERYEQQDRVNDCFEEDFYDIVDDDHCTIKERT